LLKKHEKILTFIFTDPDLRTYYSYAVYPSSSAAMLFTPLIIKACPRQGFRAASSASRLPLVASFRRSLSSTTTAAAAADAATVDDAPSASDIGGLQDKYRANPVSANVVFSSTSELTSGLQSEACIRGKHYINADEPRALGGTDTAPNPLEIMLAALGSCQEITWKAYGQASGIPLDSVSVHLDGSVDLRGFFAVSDKVRPGFQKIEGTVTVTSSASTKQLEGLKKVVDAHCPVLDMLQGVPTTISLKHEKQV
jgi:putative redox protein